MRIFLLQLVLFVGVLVMQLGVVSALPAPWHAMLVPVVLAPWWVRSRWYAFERIGWWPLLMGITADVMSPYPFGTMTVAYLALAWTVRLVCIRLIPRLSFGSYAVVATLGLSAFAFIWVMMNAVRAAEPFGTSFVAFGIRSLPIVGVSLAGSLAVFAVSQRFGVFDHVRRA